ncbi:MAG: tryptophan synthase subunit beta like protein [Pseudomonadaceae bacterium]|nr:MAG: tryptophan synthase subunit beta like protein [Pseudomonadaceae bacterium]
MFIKRNPAGQIVSISQVHDDQHAEAVSLPNDEVDTFLQDSKSQGQAALQASDYELIRVLEDLIDLLSESGTIRFTDLPIEAQRKLLERKSIRKGSSRLKLLDDENDMI